MPRAGGLAGCEVAAHHNSLSSHEQPDRTPAGTRDTARRKPWIAREARPLTLPLSEAKWQLDGRGATGVTGAESAKRLARWMPAGERTKRLLDEER